MNINARGEILLISLFEDNFFTKTIKNPFHFIYIHLFGKKKKIDVKEIINFIETF